MRIAFDVDTRPAYPVVIGPGVLAELPALATRYSRSCLVTDEHVETLYAARLGLADTPQLHVPRGEEAKTLETLRALLDGFAREHLDRSSLVIALGGGAVGDVAGLAASLYMRGIAIVHCPTTLLAMADSAIGGKTAINLPAGKNLAGSFHQPSSVFADTETLVTLTNEERRSGLGEVLKCAIVDGGTLWELVQMRAEALVARDALVLVEAIAGCARLKARIVAQDEHDQGPRKVLNLGHTFAHAIEKDAGYGTIPHGVAVGVGLMLALRASARLGLLRDPSLLPRVRALLERLDLCASLDELRAHYKRPLAVEELIPAMQHDKKNRAGELRVVLPRAAGEVVHDVPFAAEHIRSLLSLG